jgi:aspartokinase
VLHDKSALLAKASGLKMRVRSTFDDGEGTLIGPSSEGAEIPDFLGLATCSGPGNKLRVTAVFSAAAGAKGVVLARESVRAIGLDVIELDSDDPCAVVFLCPRETSVTFSQKLFEALN